MAASKSYQVISPLVITKKHDGSDLYLYEKAPLPEFVSSDETKRLLDEGFIAEVSAAAAAVAEPVSESN